MWAQDRHKRILQLLAVNGQVNAQDMADVLGVSRETVRRDLMDLEQTGQVNRVHGGAVLPEPRAEAPFRKRMNKQIRAKRDIARKASHLIQAGQSIFVDAGTTTSIFASELAKLHDIRVLTNSIDIATTIQGAGARIDLLLLGGRIASDVPATYGELTLSEIFRFNVDMAFVAPVALHEEKGGFDFDLHEAAIAEAMIRQARQTVVLVDHTKLGATSRVRYCDLAQIDILVTDKGAPESIRQSLHHHGIKIIA